MLLRSFMVVILAVLLTACDPNKIFGTRVTPPKDTGVDRSAVSYNLFSPQVAMVGGVAEKVEKVVSAGEKLYAGCGTCHGGKGEGGVGPKLQGQSNSYIKGRLVAYKNKEKVGRQSVMMWSQASILSDKDINDLSEFISENFK